MMIIYFKSLIVLIVLKLCTSNLNTYIQILPYYSDFITACPKLTFIKEYNLKLQHEHVESYFCPINLNSTFYLNCLAWIKPVNINYSYDFILEGKSSVEAKEDYSGGWLTKQEDRIAQPGKCNIEKISAKELNLKGFLSKYAYIKPVVIINATDNKEFQEYTKYDYLMNHYGHTTVKLSSANSYSYDNKMKPFKEYCQTHLEPQSLTTLANETFYFFGDNSNEDWLDLVDHYKYPPYFLPGHSPQLSFGIAGPGSGVPFHFHGPGFAETIWGRKRWFMYPPHSTPSFHPNRTTLQWLHKEYLNVNDDSELLECTLNPGELIYFPDHWWHATLNIDTTVFMSTFLSP